MHFMILYACADLIFATRIRATADALDLTSHPIRSIEKLTGHLQNHSANEPVTCLVDLDLGETAQHLIAAARRLSPDAHIIAFGPHVDKAALTAAQNAGASVAMPRSTFTTNLKQLLTQ